ncbi:MAG: MFS transporter [Phycisphaerae bacterium]
MRSSLKTLIANRNFLLLWCAYGISATGDHLSEFAILAKLNALDPNVDVTPLQARMTFVFMLPFFVLGPLAGAIGDRISRRAVMIFADVMRVGIMLAFFVLIDQATRAFGADWGPFLPLGIIGVFAALFAPSRQAMVPTLVSREQLIPANAMISGLGMIATFCAALVGGQLADRGLIREAFALDAGTFAISAMCLLLISRNRGPIHETPYHEHESITLSVVQGFRYIRAHRRVVELLGIAAVFWFCGAILRSVIPAVVKNVYGGGFSEMAWFPAWIGIGLAVGAVIITILGNALRSEWAITWSMFGAGLALTGFAGTVFIGFTPATAHSIGACCVLICGVCGAGIAVSYNALLQKIVPNQYRGRVFGILNLVTVGGLLLATGALSIPHWENFDRWTGHIIILVAVIMFAVGGITLSVRLQRITAMCKMYCFYRNCVELLCKFWYRLDLQGRCTIPREGPVIVTANHGCVIDPLLICSSCNYRSLSFMIAAEYYWLPVVKQIVATGPCIPVRRGENDIRATKTAINLLRTNHTVGIFIEGGIRNRQDPEQLKRGVAMLALRTGAKVVPAYISGTNYDDSLLKMALKRHHARIRFGPPVDLSEFEGSKGRKVLDAATRKIFDAVISLAPRDS